MRNASILWRQSVTGNLGKDGPWCLRPAFADRDLAYMRLTDYTDYSLRVLLYLAVRPEGLATIQDISDSYGISKNHLMKVVQRLAELGWVETVRGRNGGLRLYEHSSA